MRWARIACVVPVLFACGSPAPTSTIIGSAGGTITTNDVVLNVPPGALTTDVAIRITAISDSAPSGWTAYSSLFRFEPAGIVFAQPVHVAIRHPAGVVGPEVVWTSGSASGWSGLSSSDAGNWTSADVMHFSEGFVGAPSSDAGSSDGGAIEAGPLDVGALDGAPRGDVGTDAAPDAGPPPSSCVVDLSATGTAATVQVQYQITAFAVGPAGELAVASTRTTYDPTMMGTSPSTLIDLYDPGCTLRWRRTFDGHAGPPPSQLLVDAAIGVVALGGTGDPALSTTPGSVYPVILALDLATGASLWEHAWSQLMGTVSGVVAPDGSLVVAAGNGNPSPLNLGDGVSVSRDPGLGVPCVWSFIARIGTNGHVLSAQPLWAGASLNLRLTQIAIDARGQLSVAGLADGLNTSPQSYAGCSVVGTNHPLVLRVATNLSVAACVGTAMDLGTRLQVAPTAGWRGIGTAISTHITVSAFDPAGGRLWNTRMNASDVLPVSDTSTIVWIGPGVEAQPTCATAPISASDPGLIRLDTTGACIAADWWHDDLTGVTNSSRPFGQLASTPAGSLAASVTFQGRLTVPSVGTFGNAALPSLASAVVIYGRTF